MTQRILRLTLKKRWYDMIASGVKVEEYREVKGYWVSRLMFWVQRVDLVTHDLYFNRMHYAFKDFDLVQFKNGYNKNAPTITFEFDGIDIGPAVPEWSDNWQGDVFRIKIGKRVDNN